MSTGWSTTRLIGVVVVIVTAAFDSRPAQDWVPFQVAARVATTGQLSSIYLTPSAINLFDVPTSYREATGTSIENLTAFVAPPPAAFALVPLRHVSWQTSLTAWRLALAIPLVVSILWFAATLSLRDPRGAQRWSWIALASAPLLGFVVHAGQPSAWLFLAAAVSVFPSTAVRDTAGGIALGLGVLFKATPLIAVGLLWMAGRRRLATIALAVTAIGAVGSISVAGFDPWFSFFAASRRLASVVVTEWHNASLDAAVLMLTTGADGMFHEPTALSWTLGQLCRIVIIGMAVRLAFRSSETRERRAAAAWLGWLAATPLLWFHYLVVLVPILGVVPARRFGPGLILIGVVSALVVLRSTGWESDLGPLVLCAVWLASAAWLLSNMTKTKNVPTSPSLR